ncbi:MAG: hypothetical protein RMZ69_10050 [Nostoc sp. ChiQUE01a]|nr:hypothetical protein [Nostoc sp. ChiQUE01a]
MTKIMAIAFEQFCPVLKSVLFSLSLMSIVQGFESLKLLHTSYVFSHE